MIADLYLFIGTPILAFIGCFLMHMIADWFARIGRAENALHAELTAVSHRIQLVPVLQEMIRTGKVDDSEEVNNSVNSLVAVTAALSHTDWRAAAQAYAGSLGSRPESRQAVKALLTMQASPRLRRYMRPFIQELSTLINIHLQEPLRLLQQGMNDLKEPKGYKTYCRVTRIVDISLSLPIVVVGAVLLVAVWIWALLYRIFTHEWPFVRGKRLGRRAQVFDYMEVRGHLLVSGVLSGLLNRLYAFLTLYFGCWRVLIGDMSLVGTYPVCCYWPIWSDDLGRQRFAVAPGITGPAQLESRRRKLDWKEFLEKDVAFAGSASLRLYFGSLVRSVLQVFVPGKDLSALQDAVQEVDEVEEGVMAARLDSSRRQGLELSF